MNTLFGILCIVSVAVFIALIFIPFFIAVGDGDFVAFLFTFILFGLACIAILGIIPIFI